MARMRSGDVSIDVKYDDRKGHYVVKLQTPERKKTLYVGDVPGKVVDSKESLRSAAHAALSFADDEGMDISRYADSTDVGWHISGG
jgi:hypothetical protein